MIFAHNLFFISSFYLVKVSLSISISTFFPSFKSWIILVYFSISIACNLTYISFLFCVSSWVLIIFRRSSIYDVCTTLLYSNVFTFSSNTLFFSSKSYTLYLVKYWISSYAVLICSQNSMMPYLQASPKNDYWSILTCKSGSKSII